jgi:formyltetrahydrofolate synthetase
VWFRRPLRLRGRAVGDMQLMPGLGRTPAFTNIDIDRDGRTVWLY